MKINEIKIRLSGTASINQPLDLCKNYDISISNAEVRKVEEVPNDDGTADKIYKIAISSFSEVTLIGEKEMIKAEVRKGSQSQILRKVITELWEQQHAGEIDKEEFYKNYMAAIIETVKEKLI